MQGCVLAIDQGTTGTTCLVVAYDGAGAQVRGRGYQELPQHFGAPGQVEHDLEEIWRGVAQATQAACAQANVPPSALCAIGLTNQRETTCLWERRSGKALHRALVWQDRRTAADCERLRAQGHSDYVAERTGLLIDPYFSGTKLRWLLAQSSDWRRRAAAGEVCFGTVDSYLISRLTGHKEHVTDVTNACRTMLLDLRSQHWDAQMCAMLDDIPAAMLPRIAGNCELFGRTAGVPFLPDGLPITGVAGDQQAALIGQGCLQPGVAKCTYGTGAFALVHTGAQCRPSKQGLLSTIAYKIHHEVAYALEGSIFVAGALVQWLRDGLGIIDTSEAVEALAEQVSDSGGVVVVPALTGLGAPHWKPHARGLIAGLSRGSSRAHIARAALEGIAFQVYDLLAAMRKDSGMAIASLRVDGGAARNNVLLQFQADLLGTPLQRPAQVESTALGAAHLAALGIGLLPDLTSVGALWHSDRTFVPQQSASAVAAHLQRWHTALRLL